MKLILALSFLCVALVGVVAYQLFGVTPGVPRQGSLPPAGDSLVTPVLDISYDDRNAYSPIVDANLFSPARTPPARDVPAAPAPRTRPVPGLPGFQLKGIIITPDGRSALIELGRGSEYRRVVEGDMVDGWTMESIAADSISVKKEDTSTVVKLTVPPPPKKRPSPRRRR